VAEAAEAAKVATEEAEAVGAQSRQTVKRRKRDS
jgi:hypothetical protein